MRVESLWDNSKVLHDKGDAALEEKDSHVMRALGLDVQFLIDAQENIKVCRFCPLSGSFHISVSISVCTNCITSLN
jgi:hypothetical protein